jgi:hypothetical protein
MDSLKATLFFVHIFGMVWIVQVVEGIWVMTVAGAVSVRFCNPTTSHACHTHTHDICIT